MNNKISTLVKHNKDIKSLLDNIVFLDIKTSGIDPLKYEILEIGAIKVKNNNIEIFNTLVRNKKEIPLEIYSSCSRMCKSDFYNAPHLEQVEENFIDFLEDYTIVCHDLRFKKNFLTYHIPKLKNNIIDSMELAIILEPYHKEYNLDYLKQNLMKNSTRESYRTLSNAYDTLNVVNALLLRLNRKESATLEPLSFKINSYLNKFGLPNWIWSKFIDEADYDEDIRIEVLHEGENKLKYNHAKEKEVLRSIFTYEKKYEDLLKEKSIWESKEGFMYEYRQGQHELTKSIREVFDRHNTTKIGCIEAPTGIGKSVGYLLPAILEARLNKKRIIISTDTKELQIQLINKDIPNVLNSLGLNNKVSYGYIKGKNNYICVDKLDSYIHEYNPEKATIEDILSLLYLEKLVEEGKYGDIEEISHLVISKFNEIENHLRYVSCDPNLCRPKKCHKECLYKKRVEELKEEDITVINHSLLARWPYKEEKPIEYIIVDEAHNLTEKGYDFFASTIEYRGFKYLLQEIYPYENINKSPFAYNKKMRKIKTFDKFYNHIYLDREAKDKISRNINLIVEEIDSILHYGMQSEYRDISKYNLRWELNLQKDDEAGTVYKGREHRKLTYSYYSEKIKTSCETIIRNLVSTLHLIDRSMDDDNIDKESDAYKFGKSKLKDIEDVKNILQIFLEYSEDDDVARIVELDKHFNSFELKVVPLKLANLFEENILSQIVSGIFLSATLNVSGSMSYFKNTLGINRVENLEKVIDSLYDYKERISIIKVEDICGYQNPNFILEISEAISKISTITNGHILSLFNSKDRQEKTYDIVKDYLHEIDTGVYKNKTGIKNLKDINKKCVVLGSKGCFEGVDIPGDGLVCVTLDKIPNINPKDPLYSTIMKKYNKEYHNINYPQMAIKVKQAMGRILRSKYDYGCFIVFDMGTNASILKKLEKDLHGCRIISINKNNMYKYISSHLRKCRRAVLNVALKDIFKANKIDENTTMNKVESVVNKEMRSRSINSKIYDVDMNKKEFRIKYYNDDYHINENAFEFYTK